ncbi:MAG: hypothetical protein H0V45_07045 [Actinobacteria bacterium]|nr:hypothetical protein [Actinomycetota bacterium]
MAGSKQFSVRVATPVFAALERRAREAGESRTALVERYIDEGLRLDAHPRIWFREAGAARRPAILGTRLDVWQVIETIRQNNNSVVEAAEYLEVPLGHVEACVGYYVEYKDEIDEWTAREQEAAEQAETAWRRSHELFA